MTKEKALILRFNLKHGWFSRWCFRRFIRRNPTLKHFIYSYASDPYLVSGVRVDGGDLIVVNGFGHVKAGDVVELRHRLHVEVMESDIV